MKRCHYCKKWIPFWVFWKSNSEFLAGGGHVGSGYDKRLRVVHYTEEYYPDVGKDIREDRWYHKDCYYRKQD